MVTPEELFRLLLSNLSFFTNFFENSEARYSLAQNSEKDVVSGNTYFQGLIIIEHMKIDCEQQSEESFKENNSTTVIVMRLAELIFYFGHNITVDNWYTSLKLVQKSRKMF